MVAQIKPSIKTKPCSKCKELLPLTSFSRHNGAKSSKTGYRASCKKCDVEDNRLYRATNREKVNANKRDWAKNNRDKLLPTEARYREKNRDRLREYHQSWKEKNADHYKAWQIEYREKNKDRKKELDRIYQQNNKDKVNAASRRYRERHPDRVREIKKNQARRHPEVSLNTSMRRRARLAQNGVYEVTAKDIMKMLRQPCVYCGAPSEHIDHVIPIAKGGRHSIGNLAPACKSCNLHKSSKFISFWKAGK